MSDHIMSVFDVSTTVPSFRIEGGVAYYEVCSGGAPVCRRFREFVQMEKDLAACGLVIETELPSRLFLLRKTPESRRPQLQQFLRDAVSSVRIHMVRDLPSDDPCPVPLSSLSEGQLRARAVLDAFTGRGPAVQGRSLFTALMRSVGSSVCASGAAEADDDEPGAAADDATITVNEMGGRQFELRLPGSSDISEVKMRLERAGAAPVGRQALFVGGAEDKCPDNAVVSQLLQDAGVPLVLFLLVRPNDRYVQRTGPGKSQPNDFEFKPFPPGFESRTTARPPRNHELLKQRKVLFIGDSAAGKTSLQLRAATGSYVPSWITTIGVDFKIINTFWHDQLLQLQLWDSGGSHRFNAITKTYIPGSHVSNTW